LGLVGKLGVFGHFGQCVKILGILGKTQKGKFIYIYIYIVKINYLHAILRMFFIFYAQLPKMPKIKKEKTISHKTRNQP